MARKRIRTRKLPLAELRRLIPAMDEHLARFAEPDRLPQDGRVWFGRDGRVSSCKVVESNRDGSFQVKHSIRFR